MTSRNAPTRGRFSSLQVATAVPRWKRGDDLGVHRPGAAVAKARRYLAEGRLTVLEVGPQVVRATCRGDGQVYRCGWWRGSWGCTCDASQFRATCSHLLALRRVVVEPRGTAGLTPERMLAEQDEASRVRNGRRSA